MDEVELNYLVDTTYMSSAQSDESFALLISSRVEDKRAIRVSRWSRNELLSWCFGTGVQL